MELQRICLIRIKIYLFFIKLTLSYFLGDKNWGSVEEVETNLKNDHNGKFNSHLVLPFT